MAKVGVEAQPRSPLSLEGPKHRPGQVESLEQPSNPGGETASVLPMQGQGRGSGEPQYRHRAGHRAGGQKGGRTPGADRTQQLGYSPVYTLSLGRGGAANRHVKCFTDALRQRLPPQWC